MQVVGGEDEVPVLEEAVAVVAGAVAGAAEGFAAVDVELRAGAAGTLAAGLPEVLRARQLDDPLVGDAELPPKLDRLGVGAEAELVVAAEHRHPDLLGIEAESAQRQLPGEGDRLALEVVVEGEVAEHLEAGEMAGGAADLLDVGRPEAALRGGQPRRRRSLAAEEVGLERLHAGGGQQHARIVGGRDQRRRRHPQVAALLEERHVGLSDRLRIHGGEGYGTRTGGPAPPGAGAGLRRSCRGRRRDRRRRGPPSGPAPPPSPVPRARARGARGRPAPQRCRPGRRAAASDSGA